MIFQWAGGTVKCLGPGKYCCHECGRDLDENGMFPEEYSAAMDSDFMEQ